MPNPPAGGDGQLPADDEENARRQEDELDGEHQETQEEQARRLQQQHEANLARREQEEDDLRRQEEERRKQEADRRKQQEAERQAAALRKQQAEDWAASVANNPHVTMRRPRGRSMSEIPGPSAEPNNAETSTIQELRAALALSKDHIALQNQMRNMESRLFRAENQGVTSVAYTSAPPPRSEAATQHRPLHGTPTTPFVEEHVDDPEEIAERATRRLMVPALKPFTGARNLQEGADEQPFSSWIKSFEQEMALAMINRTAWLKTLRYFLQEAAATVYDSRINCLPHDRRTYQGMVEVLRHTYDRCVKEREAQRALCNLHWDPKSSTIDEFYARVEKIAASAYPQFDESARQRLVTRQFIEAMPPTTQRQIDTRIDLSPVPQAIQSFQVLDWAREITRQEEKYSVAARAYKLAIGGGRGSPGAEHQAPGDVNNQQTFSRSSFGDRGRGWRGNRSNWRGAPRGGGRGRSDFAPNSGYNERNSPSPAGGGGGRAYQQNYGGRRSPQMRGGAPPRGGPSQPQQQRGGMMGRPIRDVSDINCFNCNQKGHYARACTQAPAISTRLIRGDTVRTISAEVSGQRRQRPKRKDGRTVAESVTGKRFTSTHKGTTELNDDRKGPSPPQEHTTPAPIEHEPTVVVQNGSSEPTEQRPTREEPTAIEHGSAGESKRAPTATELHSAAADGTPTATEQGSAGDSKRAPTATELHSAAAVKGTPTATERQPAREVTAAPTPTEHESAADANGWPTPTELQSASADVTSLEGQHKSASEREVAPPTERRTPPEMNGTPAPTEQQMATDESAPKEQRPTSGEFGEFGEFGFGLSLIPCHARTSPGVYARLRTGTAMRTGTPLAMSEGELEETLAMSVGAMQPSAPTEHQPTGEGERTKLTLPLVSCHAGTPPDMFYQPMAGSAQPAPQLDRTSAEMSAEEQLTPETSAPTERRPTTGTPAADEQRPVKMVHADGGRDNNAASAADEANMVHHVALDGKRTQRNRRRNNRRKLRKQIDADSGERQQQGTSAQKGKPYTETRLMTIPVSLNGRKSSAQIDTGSPISLVGRRPILCLIAKQGRDAVRGLIKPLPKPYYDYSGNEIELKGTITLDLKLMGTRLMFDAFIDSTAHRDLILGMDVLAKMGCALRFYTAGGLTDLVVTKPQSDGKSIVTLTGGGKDLTNEMVWAERRFLERRQECLDNQRKRLSDWQPPPTKQQKEIEVKMITLEPRTREFRRFRLDPPTGTPVEHGTAMVLVEESLDDAKGEGVRIPPQLVERADGHVWLEVRNEDDAPRALHLEQLQVTVDTDYTLTPPWIEDDGHAEWVMRVPERGLDDLTGVWEPRMSQLQPYDEPMYLDGLKYTSLDERRTDLLAALDVGDAKGDVTQKDRQELVELLLRNHDVLALTDDELGCCTLPEHAHTIDTGESPPIAQPLRQLAMTKQIEVRKTLNTMKRTGVIQASCSPWSSPIVPVWKRDGSMRITVDYRRLNEVTKKDRYPLSRCDELIDSMGLERPKFFTTLDLVQGFHQMRIADEAVEKTAFSCQEGHFEYLRMPMGLTNSPASFQRLQNEILKGTDPNKVKVYLDDVAIATNTFQDHLLQLGIVFARFRKAGLRVKVQKCKFLKEKLVYLGFEISKEGVRPNEARIWDVQDFKPPTTVKMVRQFVGLCSFYRRFVPNFARIARPLTNLTRKEQEWQWGEAEAKAFQQLKDLLTSKDILAYPQWGKPYYILCDASSQGLGAILHQKDEIGRYRPIAYASRATDRYEQKYGASELECLCLVWALQHFHYYIWGQEIYVESDHQPLTCLNSKQTLPPRLERWNSIIIPYAPKIIYRRGKENEPADALSRYQKSAGTAAESAMDAVVRAIKNYPDPDVDLEEVDRNVKERQRQLQLNDQFFGRIIEAKEQQKGGRPVTRMIGKMAEKYRLQDGVLFFIGNDTEASPRLCVPLVERRVMIERYHEQRGVGGHLGAEKVFLAIAAGHFWPRMKAHVEQYCRECRVCLEQRGGAPRHKPPLAPIAAEAQPFVQVQIDVMNLPKTKKGNKKVLGIVDSFTGYLIYVPMKNEEATTVARKLHKHLFTRFNAPKRLLSDNGTNFHSNVISELNKRYGVKHYFTTTFTPHSNGKTEKANSTMRQMLAKMTQDHPEDWDELIADVMWAYNTTPIPTTGFSPHFLVFGSNPAVVSDSVFDWPTLGERLDYDDYISQLERRRAEALKIADVNRSATQERQKVRYDKKATLTAIVLGEKVMIYRPNLKTDKLKPKYDGPYEVVWLSDTVAKVRRLVDGVIETHNLDKLSRCSPTAQVTNKHQPNKPRKYQKGKKMPKRQENRPKVKKLDWNGRSEAWMEGDWSEFFEGTPENAADIDWTTQGAAYARRIQFRTEKGLLKFKSNNFARNVLMIREESDCHDSLRCLFCDEFQCVCADQQLLCARCRDDHLRRELQFDTQESAHSSTMADDDDMTGDEVLDDETEEKFCEIVFEGGHGWSPERRTPKTPSGGRHAITSPGASPGKMAATGGAAAMAGETGATAASTSAGVPMTGIVTEGNKDFGDSDSDDSTEKERKRLAAKYPTASASAAGRQERMVVAGSDDEDEDNDEEAALDDEDFLDWEGLFKWADDEDQYYVNPEELVEIRRLYSKRGTRSKESLKEGNKRRNQKKEERRREMLAAGKEDPELARLKRNLAVVYPRAIGKKVQLTQRSTRRDRIGGIPPKPPVEAMDQFQPEDIDMQLAEEQERESIQIIKERKEETERRTKHERIAQIMRTPVTVAPQARHAGTPPDVFRDNGYDPITQTRRQVIATGKCFPAPEQKGRLTSQWIGELAGVGSTTVDRNDVGDTVMGFRRRPLLAATYPAILEANETLLQGEFASLDTVDPTERYQRQTAHRVDNTALFYNGEMAKLDVDRALQIKMSQPTRNLIPADVTVVQEVPSVGPLSGASTMTETLARRSPEYLQRVISQLEETTLEQIANSMTPYHYIEQKDFDDIMRRQKEVNYKGRREVIQRSRHMDVPPEIAIHQKHPVKVARGASAAAEAAEASTSMTLDARWSENDSEDLKKLRAAQDNSRQLTRDSYDTLNRIADERRLEMRRIDEELDFDEIGGAAPGADLPGMMATAMDIDSRQVEKRVEDKRKVVRDERADTEAQRAEAMRLLAAQSRHARDRRVGGLPDKFRQLNGPGQHPEESQNYQDAMKRLHRYDKGLDREGKPIPAQELQMLRDEQRRRDDEYGYRIKEYEHPIGRQMVLFEEVTKGALADVYRDFPDTSEERWNVMSEFLLTDMAMAQYNRQTDLFNNDEYRQQFFQMVTPGQFISPMTRAVFNGNILMPRHVLFDDPPVVANRTWQLMSERADRRCTQFRKPVATKQPGREADEKEWAVCAYSYDQAGSIIRSHFLLDYRIEPIMRYVDRKFELEGALQWLLRQPDLEGVVSDTDVRFLGWDLENCASGSEWRKWRPPLKRIYNVTPHVQTKKGPFAVLLTLSNCWGYTLVIDLRFARGTRREDDTESPMPAPIEELLSSQFNHVKFICFDFKAEQAAWSNTWGKQLPYRRFIDLQDVAATQLRLCASDVMYTMNIYGQAHRGDLGLGKSICVYR